MSKELEALKQMIDSKCIETYEINEVIVRKGLERNEPMKPVKFKNTFGLCPVCAEDLGKTKYCPNCGQKLDWSEIK